MSYAPQYLTFAELEDRVQASNSRIFEKLLSQQAIGSANIQEYCEDNIIKQAESLVNGFISNQRSIPVPSTSQYYGLVQDLVYDICRYRLASLSDGGTVVEKVAEAYREAIFRLKDIGAGNFKLTDDDGEGIDVDSGNSFYMETTDAMFDSTAMDGYF